MCETLAGLKLSVSAFAARFDAALVPPAQLGQVLSDAGALEKMFAHIAAACAARMAGSGPVREAVSGLARASGTSLSEAARALEAAKQIEAQPEVAQAVRSGELSRQQAVLVAGAVANNPASARELLELARGSSMRELADESLRARSAGQGGEARRQALHASRFLRDYTGTDGAFNLHARGTPEQGAMVMAALRLLADKAFEAARKQGRRERPEAYTWDALVELATSDGGGDGRGGGAGRSGGASGGGRGRGTPRAEVIVRVDHSALLRGYPLDGEVCDIPGFGTTTVEAVRDMIATGDPFLKAIVTNGKKVVGVVHMRRRPNAYQKSALDWLFPTCAAKGCGTRACFLETDHREDWARTHVTVLELLDRLCRYHHRLKTTKGWALVEGSGKRDFVPPDDPRHPRFAKGSEASFASGVEGAGASAGASAKRGAGADNARQGAGASAKRGAGADNACQGAGASAGASAKRGAVGDGVAPVPGADNAGTGAVHNRALIQPGPDETRYSAAWSALGPGRATAGARGDRNNSPAILGEIPP